MSSCVASIIQNGLFGGRNYLLGTSVLAPEQNNQVRLLVSAGQATNLIKAGTHCGNSIFEKASDKIISACDKLAQNDKLINKLGKIFNFASKNVNKLIVVSSGVKILSAEDKTTETLAQAGNIGGMFAVEGWMKKNLATYINKLPINAKLKPILEGVVFVIGSITGSTICYNLGKKIASVIKGNNKKTEQTEQSAKSKMPKNIDTKA